MKINNKHYQTIWIDDEQTINVIDQRMLPHKFEIMRLEDFEAVKFAIKEMVVRGAPLIGVTASYGMWLAVKNYKQNEEDFETYINRIACELMGTRPTAINLEWAVKLMLKAISQEKTLESKYAAAFETAEQIKKTDVFNCEKIGSYGLSIIKNMYIAKNRTINILTHCNAGWLATVDWGTALAPIYKAHDAGIDIHVWIDETRPRNQGAALTAFELLHEKVPHTLIADNAGGHLMQNGMVDLMITGADRMAHNGDVANKIGTYLKALAAKANNIPFYVALPSSTIDNSIAAGKNIPIEVRNADEVLYVSGMHNGALADVLIAPVGTPAINYGFDITPAHLITGIITETGIIMR